MRLALCLSILAAPIWAADQGADRASIEKVISTLNSAPRTPGLFTDDFADFSVLKNLGLSGETSGELTVGSQCVSREPWGELGTCRTTPSVNLAIATVKWITPEVAMVETAPGITAARSWPVLVVLRKSADDWKIASIRMVIPRAPVDIY